MKYTKNLLGIAAAAGLAFGFSSCSDKDEYFNEEYQTTPISVTRVFLEDYKSTVADRQVDFGRLGQTLRLEGSGFMGLKKIYVNGYETYFNRNLVTDNTIIFSLNSKTPITTAEEDQRDIIRLVKDGTELAYQFTIRAASPTIVAISNTLPAAGETVTVTGTGLQETTVVTFPDRTTLTEGIVSDDVEGEWFTFVMPDGINGGGSLTATCANGTAKSPEYFNNTDCMILDFDGRYEQGFWSADSNPSMITDEDLVPDPLGQRGKVWQVVPDRLRETAFAASKSRIIECWTSGNDNPADDWTRMTEFIDPTTPVTELAFQFDVYCPDAWGTTGQIEIVLINNYNFSGYTSDDNNGSSYTLFWIPWAENDEPYSNTGWTTVTIPLSEMGKFKEAMEEDANDIASFQDVIEARNTASYRNFGMGMANTDFTFDGKEFVSENFLAPRIYIDSWRIVPCKEIEVTDFPEDEEE